MLGKLSSHERYNNAWHKEFGIFLPAQTDRQTWCTIIIIVMNLDKNDYDSNFGDSVVGRCRCQTITAFIFNRNKNTCRNRAKLKSSRISRTNALHNSWEELKMENFLYMRIWASCVLCLLLVWRNISRYYSSVSFASSFWLFCHVHHSRNFGRFSCIPYARSIVHVRRQIFHTLGKSLI